MTLESRIGSISAVARILAGIAISVVLGTAVAKTEVPYVLIDSGFPSHELYQPFWIDNDRLIFRGYEPGSYNEEMRHLPIPESAARGYEYTGMKTGYYIWDTRTGQVNLYKHGIEDLCAEGDSVIYRSVPASEEEKSIVWQGKIGAEKQTQINPRFLPRRNNGLPRECWNMFPDPAKNETKGRIVHKLRADFGYLDMGPRSPSGVVDRYAAVVFYRAQIKDSIALPIQAGLLIAARVHFTPHEDRYLIEERPSSSSNVGRAWYLSKDGAIESVALPQGPWSTINLYPVRDGFFISSRYTKGKGMGQPGGAYVVRTEKWRLLFAGHKGPAGVSPNGCGVAMSVAPNFQAHLDRFQEWKSGKVGKQTMRVIIVCDDARR